ncbi:MAG: pyrroline-5-carboxylate reductase [Actinomycetota bacterium]|jgi:pyrroline-5-carboxylate reductase|nr:pyrroline-5-carboxylate reductase [Actinomycetota bacterium]
MTRLVVVGGGRMGNALVGGLLRSGWVEPGDITIAEQLEGARDDLAGRFPGVVITSAPVVADSAVIAVKPSDAESAVREVAKLRVPRVLSIMAGVKVAKLESWLPAGTAVLRAMPNLPAVLGSAASALAGGDSVTESDFAWAEAVLSSFGVVARVSENALDAVTGLSGSGPAYLFLLAEAMIEAGVAQGLDRGVSRLLVTNTVLGSARLLAETGDTPEVLRAAITSPGGTTAAGLGVLERRAFRSAVIDAVAAAAARSRELGDD